MVKITGVLSILLFYFCMFENFHKVKFIKQVLLLEINNLLSLSELCHFLIQLFPGGLKMA